MVCVLVLALVVVSGLGLAWLALIARSNLLEDMLYDELDDRYRRNCRDGPSHEDEQAQT